MLAAGVGARGEGAASCDLLPAAGAVPGTRYETTSTQVVAQLGSEGLAVTLMPGPEGYPGVVIRPVGGTNWDLSAYGHVEATVSNAGTNALTLILQAESEGDWRERPWSADKFTLKPAETRTVAVSFGYDYGAKSAAFKPARISAVRLYTAKTSVERLFRIAALKAAGIAGETPPVDPARVAVRPPRGMLFGPGVAVDAARQLVGRGQARLALADDGKALAVTFSGGREESVTFKPAAGMWNLSDGLEVRVKVRNAGTVAATPGFRLESRRDGQTDYHDVHTRHLEPGEEADVAIPFAARTPWVGVVDKDQEVAAVQQKPPRTWGGQPNTGTRYRSNQTTGLTLLSDATPGAKSLQVLSITCGLPALNRPAWLGKRPPVDGDWTLTFEDNFDGDRIDLTRWNVVVPNNYWDKRTHFSRDNVIVRDGKLALRVEHKRGRQNDAADGVETEYATGVATTLGKWTQRYGYFEARVKLPTAPNMFYAFWTMPDRGLAAGPEWKRSSTADGGMEFDIMEGLSAWGIHRHDFGCHWDDYGKKHQGIGADAFYCQADDEGFMVVGMLWEPGRIVLYDNGAETARWESPRISNVQAYLILDHVTGGWETEGMDDTKLPADLVFDWVRAWQRKDLASPGDGAKPNQGTPAAPAE